jgi:CRP/FNR family transcriptional regulator, cyclic AMP receptor protein
MNFKTSTGSEERAISNKNVSTGDSLGLRRLARLEKVEQEYQEKEMIFARGDVADALFSIRRGLVKLGVTTLDGKEAVLRILREGDIFGEECLATSSSRNSTAMAIEPSILIRVPRASVARAIRRDPTFAKSLVAHFVHRVEDAEEELADQILNSSEKRLAKALLKIAGVDKGSIQGGILPAVDQKTLADMVGTTRSRVSYFMNRFRRLGLIDYNGSLKVYPTLLEFLNRE